MYYPDLKLPEDETPHYGKYGRMRKALMMNNFRNAAEEIVLSELLYI